MIKGESDIYDSHKFWVANNLWSLNVNQTDYVEQDYIDGDGKKMMMKNSNYCPVIQWILMCRDEEQARIRCHEQNPGRAHAMAAVDMIEMSLDEENTVP